MFACLDFAIRFIQNFNHPNKFHAYTNQPNENFKKTSNLTEPQGSPVYKQLM